MLITHIMGLLILLITIHEPPSRGIIQGFRGGAYGYWDWRRKRAKH